jgi:hypothetical protein
MTAEHIERQYYEPRPAADVAVDLIHQLASSELLTSYPHLGDELERILTDLNSIHSDGREWDRRVLVERFDKLVVNLLLVTNGIVNPEEAIEDYSI